MMRYYLENHGLGCGPAAKGIGQTGDGMFFADCDRLNSLRETLGALLRCSGEYIRVSAQKEALENPEDHILLDWMQPLPETLSDGKTLGIFRFAEEKRQYIGRACGFGGQEVFFLSIECTGKKGVLWYAAAYNRPEIWEAENPTRRDCLLREAEADKPVCTDAFPSAVDMGGEICRGTEMRFFYTDCGDPWPDAYRAWLAGRREFPAPLAGKSVVFVRQELRGKAEWTFPPQSLTFRFSPLRRRAVLQQPFTIDLKNPQTELSFELNGKAYRLSIVEIKLENLRDALRRTAEEQAMDVEADLVRIPENERDVALVCRFPGGEGLSLEIYPKAQLDAPDPKRNFAIGVIRRCRDPECRCLEAGKILLPAPDFLEMELFSVCWEEPAADDMVIL